MYIRETMKAGNVIETRKYFATRYGVHHGRAQNANKTEAAQKRVNDRNAERRLRGLINANFGANDLFITLTYSGDNPKQSEAKAALGRFLRKLRTIYKRNGEELKYICVTEYEAKRIHHHAIINGCIGLSDVQTAWESGMVRAETMRGEDHAALAAYLIKETKRTYCATDAFSKKRWCASRNLKQPEITKEIIPARMWRDEPKPIKGYTIVKNSLKQCFDCFGRPVQEYFMVKLPERRTAARSGHTPRGGFAPVAAC